MMIFILIAIFVFIIAFRLSMIIAVIEIGIGILFYSIVLGFVVQSVNEDKGYTGGYLWGFFLHLLGLAVILAKQDSPNGRRKIMAKPFDYSYLYDTQNQTNFNCENSQK